MSFLPYNKVYALVSSNVKQSQLIVEQGWMVQVMNLPDKFEPLPF
jgi:hypothetical protein